MHVSGHKICPKFMCTYLKAEVRTKAENRSHLYGYKWNVQSNLFKATYLTAVHLEFQGKGLFFSLCMWLTLSSENFYTFKSLSYLMEWKLHIKENFFIMFNIINHLFILFNFYRFLDLNWILSLSKPFL